MLQFQLSEHIWLNLRERKSELKGVVGKKLTERGITITVQRFYFEETSVAPRSINGNKRRLLTEIVALQVPLFKIHLSCISTDNFRQWMKIGINVK